MTNSETQRRGRTEIVANAGWLSGPALAKLLVGLIAVAIVLSLWVVFRPGLMSVDSISQYSQAVTGAYDDWHPPLISALLRAVMAAGGGLAQLTLLQCLAGIFGLLALSSAVLEITPAARRLTWIPWLSLTVLVLLLLPLSPLPFYLMTFWKDVWALVLLLWIGALSLSATREHGRRGLRWRLAAVVVLSTVFALVRHNALFTLPALSLLLWQLARRHESRRAALVLALSPCLAFAAAEYTLARVLAVTFTHPASQVMAMDLVGLCAADRAVCRQLEWTSSHVLDEAALASYRPGDVGFIFWDKPRHVDPAIRSDYPRLRAEYVWAAVRFPLLLARIKLEAFATLLGHDRTFYFFHDSIVDNRFGLSLDPRLDPARRFLSTTVGATGRDPRLRWVFGVHVVWMVINGIWLVALWPGRHDPPRRTLALLLAVTVMYYLSYLAATPIHDFRFMYPASLFVQCVTLSWGLGALRAAGTRPRDRARRLVAEVSPAAGERRSDVASPARSLPAGSEEAAPR